MKQIKKTNFVLLNILVISLVFAAILICGLTKDFPGDTQVWDSWSNGVKYLYKVEWSWIHILTQVLLVTFLLTLVISFLHELDA
jgi:hypothetical protein